MDAPHKYDTNQAITTIKSVRMRLKVVPTCENPISMNKWCRCSLSGRKGDIPLIIRADITLSVSKTGTAKTDKVNGTSPTPFIIKTVLAGLVVRYHRRR